jgi:hypothetical protein
MDIDEHFGDGTSQANQYLRREKVSRNKKGRLAPASSSSAI